MTGGPRCAVLAVVSVGGRVLLARRRNAPDAGLWGFPGGRVGRAERLGVAAERELREETPVRAEAGDVLDALDVIPGDGNHFVLIALAMRWRDGDGAPAGDVAEIGWFEPSAVLEPQSAGVPRILEAARRAGWL